MKAIETTYHGVKFRSRLEARWAVFFDACGVEWIYEPEAFSLPNGPGYTPDFLLPNEQCFAEVKPSREAAESAHEKLAAFKESLRTDEQHRGFMLLVGEPDKRAGVTICCGCKRLIRPDDYRGSDYHLGESLISCEACDIWDRFTTDAPDGSYYWHEGWWCSQNINLLWPAVCVAASEKARTYRFWNPT